MFFQKSFLVLLLLLFCNHLNASDSLRLESSYFVVTNRKGKTKLKIKVGDAVVLKVKKQGRMTGRVQHIYPDHFEVDDRLVVFDQLKWIKKEHFGSGRKWWQSALILLLIIAGIFLLAGLFFLVYVLATTFVFIPAAAFGGAEPEDFYKRPKQILATAATVLSGVVVITALIGLLTSRVYLSNKDVQVSTELHTSTFGP